MPIIREYQQTVRPAGPGAVINAPLSIADAAAAPDRAIQKALSQTAEIAYAFGERIDKSRVAKDAAEARADLTIQIQDDVQSGRAATRDWNFDEKIAKRLEKTQEGYHTGTGTSMAAAAFSAMRAEFRIQANHYQTVAIGQQAALGFKQAMEAHQKTLQADPMQYDSVRAEVLTILHDPNGPYARDLSAQKIAELDLATRTELAVNAMRGVINTRLDGPEAAKELIAKGLGPAKDLTADQQTQMIGEADRAARDREIENERLLRFEERQRKKENLAVGNDFFARNTKGALSIKAIRDSSLPWQEKRYWEAAIQDKAEKTDPRAVNDTLNKIVRGEITRDDQLPLLGNGVTYADRQHMLATLARGAAGTELRVAVDAAQRFLEMESYGEPGFSFLSWQREFSSKWDEKVKAKEDPTVLIRSFPGNKENMVTPDRLRAHVQSFAAQADEIVRTDQDAFVLAKAEMAKGGGKLPRPKTREEALTLGPGAYFINPQGKLLRNPLATSRPAISGPAEDELDVETEN